MAETLTEHDLRGLFALIEEGRRDHPTEGMPWAVLEGLAALVPCDEVLFPEADLARGHGLLSQWYRSGDRTLTVGDEGLPAEFWAYIKQFTPCVVPDARTGNLPVPLHHDVHAVLDEEVGGKADGLQDFFFGLPGQAQDE